MREKRLLVPLTCVWYPDKVRMSALSVLEQLKLVYGHQRQQISRTADFQAPSDLPTPKAPNPCFRR